MVPDTFLCLQRRSARADPISRTMSWCRRRFFREPRMSRSGSRLRRSTSEIKRSGGGCNYPHIDRASTSGSIGGGDAMASCRSMPGLPISSEENF